MDFLYLEPRSNPIIHRRSRAAVAAVRRKNRFALECMRQAVVRAEMTRRDGVPILTYETAWRLISWVYCLLSCPGELSKLV